jgi:hypothetical protein
MSTRSFRARLDRLEQSADRADGQERDPAPNFTIDPEAAKALRDDVARKKVLFQKQMGGPLSSVEIEEEGLLRLRIAERARAIACPPDYGAKECETDSDRLIKVRARRNSPPSRGGDTLSEAEDAKEAQLIARIEAFRQTPEGLARDRIHELTCKKRGVPCKLSSAEQIERDRLQLPFPEPTIDLDNALAVAIYECRASFRGRSMISVAEQDELDTLKPLYPDPPPDPNSLCYDALVALREHLDKREEAERRERQQRRLAERRQLSSTTKE